MSGREVPRPAVPGAEYPVCVPDETGHCSVCGDEGLVGTVLELSDRGDTARVRLDEASRGSREIEAALDLLDGVAPGDRIVVHMGFAIGTVREGDR